MHKLMALVERLVSEIAFANAFDILLVCSQSLKFDMKRNALRSILAFIFCDIILKIHVQAISQNHHPKLLLTLF